MMDHVSIPNWIMSGILLTTITFHVTPLRFVVTSFLPPPSSRFRPGCGYIEKPVSKTLWCYISSPLVDLLKVLYFHFVFVIFVIFVFVKAMPLYLSRVFLYCATFYPFNLMYSTMKGFSKVVAACGLIIQAAAALDPALPSVTVVHKYNIAVRQALNRQVRAILTCASSNHEQQRIQFSIHIAAIMPTESGQIGIILLGTNLRMWSISATSLSETIILI
jgi:hypothetical protein